MDDETLTEKLARALATADGYEKPDWSTVVLVRALLPIVREAERAAARDALDGMADGFDEWHRQMHTAEVADRIRHERDLLYPDTEKEYEK